MASVAGPGRPADEAEAALLATDGTGEHSRRATRSMMRSPAWLHWSSYIHHAARATARRLQLRVLLVFVPLGLAAAAFNLNPIVISICNFFAIIPLSACVSDLSDKLGRELGDLLGALINATFGNAVELIVVPSWPSELATADRGLLYRLGS